MDILQIRLDLLKLTYRSDRRPEEAVTSAKVLEEYLLESQKQKAPIVQAQGTESVAMDLLVDKEPAIKSRRGRKPNARR